MHGKVIGGAKNQGGKWLCKVCKMGNEKEDFSCSRCKELKQVFIEKGPRNAQSQGPSMRFSNAAAINVQKKSGKN